MLPAGYVPLGTALQNTRMLELWVQSDLHSSDEYGQEVSCMVVNCVSWKEAALG
jgi:hypothetical protein